MNYKLPIFTRLGHASVGHGSSTDPQYLAIVDIPVVDPGFGQEKQA